MFQITQWMSQAQTSINKVSSKTYSQITSIAKYSLNAINPLAIAKNIEQALYGIAVPLNPKIIPVLVESKDLQKGLKTVVVHNSIYLTKILSFHATQYAIEKAYPDYKDSYIEIYLPLLVLGSTSLQMLVYNTFYNMYLNAIMDRDYSNQHQFAGCKDSVIQKARASIEENIFHVGKLSQAYIMSKIPLIGPYLAPPILVMAYGQAFWAYNLDKYCTEHRPLPLAYTGGIGLIFYVMAAYLSSTISHLVRSENYYTNYLIFDAVFPVVAAWVLTQMRLAKKPNLKGVVTVDPFRPSKVLTADLIQQITALLIKDDPKQQIDWRKIKKNIQHFAPFEIMCKLMFPREFLSLQRFAQTEAIEMILKVKGDEIQQKIKFIAGLRDNIFAYLFKAFLAAEKQKVLKIIFSDGMTEQLLALDAFIERARQTHKNKNKITGAAILEQEIPGGINEAEDYGNPELELPAIVNDEEIKIMDEDYYCVEPRETPHKLPSKLLGHSLFGEYSPERKNTRAKESQANNFHLHKRLNYHQNNNSG